ncbi:MAG: hypothetical protein LUG89_05575, partial [Methanosphaera sp.]|nr:hypothetical protein [Methanosphaera sp.]
TNTIDTDNNTLILSLCTGEYRTLEIGVSVYAGYMEVPLILTDKTLPDQLSQWLPAYVQENNITKIVVVGEVTNKQLLDFTLMGLEVEVVNGDSIADILTTIAENTPEVSNDTVIFSASDPLAGYLGAYTKIPVFMTASNSSYESSQYLDEEYIEYLESHDIKHIIIVGDLPDTIINQLSNYNATIEKLDANGTDDLSMVVNNKLQSMGYLNNTTTTYYGFYGEIPSIIPNAITNNAMVIEDSSNQNSTIEYLEDNNITDIIFTRNQESDYILMEETDYISSTVVDDFTNKSFNISFLTNQRTLDEATGLYDVKINSIEELSNNKTQLNISQPDNILDSQPPLISILNYSSAIDSNNISLEVSNDDGNYTLTWSTIHPYTASYNNTSYYITSNTGYEYFWNYTNNTWLVDYVYNNTTYYHVEWIKNPDNSWCEIHNNTNYTWINNGSMWYCYDQSDELVYYINYTT